MSAVLQATAAGVSPWRRALAVLVILIAAILLLYRDTFVAMVGIWSRSDTFAHAFLVPPIVLWLAWRRREALVPYLPGSQPWLLLPVALAAVGWLLGDMAGVNAVTQLCATALLVLAVPAVLGLAVARQLVFPLAFLFFMVPVGEFLLPVMMEATADFTVSALQMTGVPVYREGLQFIIPTGAWSVVEACSGVRYLIASFMVGSLFAYLNYNSNRKRWLFAGFAILVPVVANWLRAYMIVMLGHLSGNTVAVGADHLIYGWVFFGAVIMVMFMIGARWSEAPAAVAAPLPRLVGQAEPGPRAWVAFVVLAMMVLAAPPVAAWQWAHSPPAASVTLKMPTLPGAPLLTDQPALLTPVFHGAAAQATATYAGGNGSVTVHVAYFRHQGYGAKLASSENTLVRSRDPLWHRVASGHTTIRVAGETVVMRTATMASNSGLNALAHQRLDAQQVYWVGGRLTTSDQWATVLGVYGRLSGRGDDGAIITFYTQGDAADLTSARLSAFVAAHLPALRAQLDAVQRAR